MIALLLILSISVHTGIPVKANTKQGYVTGNNVRVRKGPGTEHGEITKLNNDHPVTILEQDSNTSWYKIQFNQNGSTLEGWMTNQYIRIEVAPGAMDDFEKHMNDQGFPESYKSYLRDLHIKHPNWEFRALHTGLDWNTVVKNQLNPVNKSLVPLNSIASWKSLEQGSYNWDNGTWYSYETVWAAASSEILQFFMDPRNALVSGGEILQFSSLGWTGRETKAGVQDLLSGTFMANSDLDYAQYFMTAGQTHGVSPYHLVSRVIQEVSRNGSRSTDGATGVYNFYNIGAFGSNPVDAGLTYARDKGWTSPEKAIIDGAGFITDGYIKTGQDTLYLQKFDVVDGGNGFYWHQYMTNIQAPTSEAKKLQASYPNFNNGHIVFKIPVYSNMPATPCTKPTTTTAPNFLLSSLSVNNYSLTPFFNKFTENYSIIVPEDVSSITISASPVLSTTKITGAGSHNLKEGLNEIKIISTAANGQSKVYTINVSRGTVDYSGSTNYKIGTNITGVSPETSVEAFKNNMKVNNATIDILNPNGTPLTGNVGTGSIIQVKQGNQVLNQHQVVIYGDTNGDGRINIVDLANVQKHILNVSKMDGIYAQAANTKKTGSNINIVDLANIQKHILKVSSISQ